MKTKAYFDKNLFYQLPCIELMNLHKTKRIYLAFLCFNIYFEWNV